MLNTAEYDEDRVVEGDEDQPSMYNRVELGTFSIDFTNALNVIDNAVGMTASAAGLMFSLLSLTSLF